MLHTQEGYFIFKKFDFLMENYKINSFACGINSYILNVTFSIVFQISNTFTKQDLKSNLKKYKTNVEYIVNCLLKTFSICIKQCQEISFF